MRIAWLNEDETSTSLLELLRRVHEALSKRYPDEFKREALEPLFDLAPEEAENALAQLLLTTLQERTLEEARELLRGIARLNGQSDVVAFLDSATGRSCIRALHHLSGGNHRLYRRDRRLRPRENPIHLGQGIVAADIPRKDHHRQIGKARMVGRTAHHRTAGMHLAEHARRA